MAGLFFCLASTEGAGLLFCPDTIQPRTSVYSVFCRVNANYTVNATKQRAGLYSGLSCDCARSTAHDTRPARADIIPSATRWSAYTRPDALNRSRYNRHAETLHRPAQPPIIIRYIRGCKGAPCCEFMPDRAAYRRPCQRHRVSSQAGHSGTLYPAGQSSGRGVAGGAELLAATAAALFGLSPDSQ